MSAIDRLHDLIAAWHAGDGDGVALHAYLRLTWGQYARWVETGVLPDGYEPPNYKED